MQTAILGTRQGEQLTLDSGETGGRRDRPVRIVAAARQASLTGAPDALTVTLSDGRKRTLAASDLLDLGESPVADADWRGTAAAIVGRHYHRGSIV